MTTLYCGWLWISLFTGSATTSLLQHSTTPQISQQRASVTTDSSVTPNVTQNVTQCPPAPVRLFYSAMDIISLMGG